MKRCIKIGLYAFCLITTFQSFTQYNATLRGKIIPFGLEDVSVFGYNIGLEGTLFYRHSFGIDFCGWKIFGEIDDSEDVGMYKTRTVRSAFFVDYKFTFLQIKTVQVFATSFVKLKGKDKEWIKKIEYDFEPSFNLLKLEEKKYGTFNDIGIGLGTRVLFSPNVGIECSVSAAKRKGVLNSTLLSENTLILEESIDQYVVWKPLLRVSLFFSLKEHQLKKKA